jgi:hypothetical protein
MVDFTRFMGRGALEPRFPVPNLGSLPAPTPIAPPSAPLPSVAPAPAPAPVAPPLPIPDLSNFDLSGLPGLPQMPLPQPIPPVQVAPAPVPEPITPPPLPPVPVPTPVPPMEIAPAPVPEPITPPPLPPRPPVNILEPAPPMEVAPGPIPELITPPPLPPTPTPTPVPPLEVAPGPIPEPVMPPPLPPQNTFLPPEFMEQLPNFGSFVPPAPANPIVQEPAPAPVTGIETLAPEDYTESVASFEGIPMPDGTVLSMNEISEAQGFRYDPSGQFDPFGFSPNVTPPQSETTELPANTVDFGYGAVNVEDLAAIGVPGFGFDSETGGVTFDADEMVGTTGGGQTANAGYTPTFDNMYTYREEPGVDDFTFGGGDTGGTVRDTRFIDYNNNGIDDRDEGVDVNGNTGGTTTGTGTTGGSTSAGTGTTSGYGDWYNNLSDEQRAAFDTWMANNTSNGVITTPFGSFNLNQYTGTGTGTTTVTPVESNFEFTARTPAGSGENVVVATQYALPGTVAPRAPADNPFERPETQEGIGSLAGGG